jgi:hypothetical protein
MLLTESMFSFVRVHESLVRDREFTYLDLLLVGAFPSVSEPNSMQSEAIRTLQALVNPFHRFETASASACQPHLRHIRCTIVAYLIYWSYRRLAYCGTVLGNSQAQRTEAPPTLPLAGSGRPVIHLMQ